LAAVTVKASPPVRPVILIGLELPVAAHDLPSVRYGERVLAAAISVPVGRATVSGSALRNAAPELSAALTTNARADRLGGCV
jgi:hypothetical protein